MNERTFKETHFNHLPAPFGIRWSPCKGGKGVYPLHWHELYELHLMTRGCMTFVIDDKVHQMERNTLILIRPREHHQFFASPAFNERLTVFLDPAWLGRAGRFGDSVPSRVHLTDKEAALMLELLQRAQQEVDAKMPFWQSLARHQMLTFVLLVRRAACRPGSGTLVVTPLMQQLIAHLDAHYKNRLTLKELGAAFGYSGYYLEHEFSRSFGMGIKHYVLQRRINEAQTRMTTPPHLTLAAIAQAVGFKEYAGFQRAFLKITGVSPKDYRKMAQPEDPSRLPVS